MALVTNVIKGSNAQRLLLLVHGYGADERDLGGVVPYLDPEGRFLAVLPRGPVAAPPGFAWFDLDNVHAGPVTDATFTAALDELDDLLDTVCTEHDLARSEAVVGGFSQGGVLALALALRRSERAHPAGVLAFSAYLPDVEGIDLDWDAAESIPVLVQHGTDDPLIPVDAGGRALARALIERGVPTTYAEFPMGHSVAVAGLEQAHEWLLAVSAGETPSAPMPEPPPEPLVKAVTTAEFERDVLGSDLPVIVDFWAPWCGPCRQVSPVIEQMAAMREGSYKFVKVNIDEEPQLAEAFEVQSIPLIGLFRNGRMERASLGLKPRQQLEAELGMLVIP